MIEHRTNPRPPRRKVENMPVYSKNDDYVNRIKRFLADHQIDTYRFSRTRGDHRVVIVTRDGRDTKVFFPLSGSDWRGPLATVTSLRRALGLVNGGGQ
jgi:hypothetical protein